VIAGHLDTVPVNDNLPSRREGGLLHGLGTCDMKAGDAVILKLAATIPEPTRDVTYILYEAEEIEAAYNGLHLLAQSHPELLVADFAILMEPSDGVVEAGCQGTMRVDVHTAGTRAHSARSWLGDNAIHKAGEILARLGTYEARTPDIDGLTYHEGLNAVYVRGGVAGNVIPDECVVEVNFRYAPDRSPESADAYLRGLVPAGADYVPAGDSPPARVVTDSPLVQRLRAAGGLVVEPKQAWTNVADFTARGIDAVNFGPGAPRYAHRRDERVEIAALVTAFESLWAFLVGTV